MKIETTYDTKSHKFQLGAIHYNNSGLKVAIVGRVTKPCKKKAGI